MLEAVGARSLWAMHPQALGALLKRGSIAAMLPDALQGLAGFGGAAALPDAAIRSGATAIVPLRGPLSPRGSYGGTSTERFADQVRAAAGDADTAIILLDVMSAGGLVYGTAEAADAVYAARLVKPVIAVANPFAFSAAHWIATQATAYYASTSGRVGSTGVRGGHVDMSGLEAKLGLRTTLVASSAEKIAGHPHAPLSDVDRAEMQREIDEANRTFVAAIARGRRMAAADVPRVHGEGRTFSAAQAAAACVTDGVATLRDAVAVYRAQRATYARMCRQAGVSAALLPGLTRPP